MTGEHENVGGEVGRGTRPRVLLFTDTLGDVNGVSRFIRNIAEEALRTGRNLRVVTSTNFECPAGANIQNFRPLAAMRMPGYPNLELVVPPVLSMLREVRRVRPDVVHISTPGPVGCVGLLAARRLGVPVLGVYHTDFPAYVERLFENELFTAISRGCMRLFYRRFATIFTRSAEYVERLRNLGLACGRYEALRPGIMLDQFHPRFRDTSIWAGYGSRGGQRVVRVLSVGRVSVEKNMPLLSRVWPLAAAELRARGVEAELVVVGDGPHRGEMEEALSGTPTRFLGFRYGEELSRLYASSDVFVFPSVTDTLGQVVMESQASGLPVLVSDQGGPKEVVEDGRTGFVLPAAKPGAWVERLVQLCSNAAQRRVMGAEAHEAMQRYSMAESFEHWWGVHEEAVATRPSHVPGTTSTNPHEIRRFSRESVPL
jgi:glycosyltransferase involved in cell wall biosynthesis